MTGFDMTESIAPKSDQLNAEDLLSGPRTVTIAEVRKGSAEQPVDIHLVEFPGRPFKPSKTVRRILVSAWGPDASTYAGRRMTLYRDPAVRFGGQDVGGIRVSHLSHIDKQMTVALTVTRGRRAPYVVEPLPDRPPSSPEPISKGQLTALNAALTALGYNDRAAIYAVLSRELGRPITSSSELTKAQATDLIDRIQRGEVQPPPPPDDEPPADHQGEPFAPGADQ